MSKRGLLRSKRLAMSSGGTASVSSFRPGESRNAMLAHPCVAPTFMSTGSS